MKVRVIKPCFIDSRLRVIGAEIEIRADLFSATSMEKLDELVVQEPVAEMPRRGRPPKQRVE